MKSKSVLLLILAAVIAAGSSIVVYSAVNSEKKEKLDQVFAELEKEGCRPKEVITDGDTLRITTYSFGQDTLCAEDVRAIRAARNHARLLVSGSLLFKDIKIVQNVIENKSGNVLYDATINQFTDIPREYMESIRIRGKAAEPSEEGSVAVITEALKCLPVEIIKTEENALGGFFVELKMNITEDSEIEVVNSTAEKCLAIFETLNKDGNSIGGYSFTVSELGVEAPVFFLSADLVYHDFLWWQAPELGSETWTGSTPKHE